MYLLCREPFQHFVQQGVQGLGFRFGEVHAAGHGLGDTCGLALERFALVGKAYRKATLVAFFAGALDIALGFELFQKRGERAGIEEQLFAEFRDVTLLFFPEHEHHDVLRVREVERLQVRGVAARDLFGHGVQREAQLIFEF